VKRFPLIAFAALLAATVAAFFVTQHLKVTTPFYAGFPAPQPGSINPNGTTCSGAPPGPPAGNYRRTDMSFYLLHRADDVNMYVVNEDGAIVRTVASGVHMGVRVRTNFSWNGRLDDGAVAPDGTYEFRVALIQQGRTLEIGGPIEVITVPPHPVVTGVSPALIPQGTTPVTIHFRDSLHFRGLIQIYRTDVPGRPQLVDSFLTARHPKQATWNGEIGGQPAPAGTYLVGFSITDRACNTGRFPIVLPPQPGSTPHAGVTVRYLAAEPPLTPVAAGAEATVQVDSRTEPYRWALRVAGEPKVLARGSGKAPGVALPVRLPRNQPELYELSLRSGSNRTVVPLVASGTAPSPKRPRVLLVLPALTWEGENPVDDDGDGLPNTLSTGGPITLNRVFADGYFPAGVGDEEALLAYLSEQRMPFDLTTDIGLIDGVGPKLDSYKAVVFPGSERWIPESLGGALREYVQRGGHLLSLGFDSLRRTVTISGDQALHPTGPAPADALGAKPGQLVPHSRGLVIVIHDALGIFSTTSQAFPGFSSYQPYTVPPPGKLLSAAGVTTASPVIVGYSYGRGDVVDIGLAGFTASLSHDVDSQELLNRLWQVLGH
jgi:hypothetical protein